MMYSISIPSGQTLFENMVVVLHLDNDKTLTSI